MGEGKSGRPPEGTAAKTGMIALRTDPKLKATLQEQADRKGLSLAREVELRLRRTLKQDAFGGEGPHEELLRPVMAAIQDAETTFAESWLVDLRSWAFVEEAISKSIMPRLRPSAINSAEADEKWRELFRIKNEKKAIAEEFSRYGILVDPNADGTVGKAERGMFGAQLAVLTPRWSVAAQIKEYPVEEQRADMELLLDRLRVLDTEEATARDAWFESMKDTFDAIDEGRRTFHAHDDRTHEKALSDALAAVAGKPTDGA